MAYSIPESIRSTATAGERLLFRTLKMYLPDDYIVYYEPEIHGRRPDFVVIGPDLGLIVLEVKDYTKSTLLQLNPDEWIIQNTKGEQTTTKSPIKQARDNVFHITDTLKKDKNLVRLEKGKYQFNLKFPYGYGAVFTRLYQQDFIELGLYSVVEPSLSLTRDEIDPDNKAFTEENLFEKISNMFIVPYRLKEPLTPEEIDAIRYHLFPEVRISAEFKAPVPYQDQLLLSLHDIKAMDLHQENLAKQIGNKNRLIRGVAGSGKTLILASRAKLLARENPNWKILILTYNISLARSIEQMVKSMMHEPDLIGETTCEYTTGNEGQVEVRNFHDWLHKELKIKEETIALLLEKMKKKEAIFPKYDAVLVDEGQDFKGEWLKLITNILNPETQSLLLVEDRAQNIYKRKRSYIQETGMDFRGRSKILNINYRNTAQIVSFAWEFYKANSEIGNKVVSKEFEGEIIAPQSTRRKGSPVAIVKTESFWEECRLVAKQIKRLHEVHQVPLSEILIIYRVKNYKQMNYIAVLKDILDRDKVPYYWLSETPTSKRAYDHEQECITISTFDSSKGLDFKAVLIMNIDNMPLSYEKDLETEVSRLYIGMTRAQQFLWLSYSAESAFTKYFDKILKERALINEEITLATKKN